ncbi:MAG: hypothetical protein GF401_13650 [Chitinivibrionales bacterium]|nr:hypothetical protein [Chitinivibrionales bacterium]
MQPKMYLKSCFLLCMVFFVCIHAQTPSPRCKIKNLVGTVKIRKGAGPRWIPARPSMTLKKSDAVRTFVESMVEIEMADGSELTLNENSTVELTDLTQKKSGGKSTKIKIMTGKVMSNIQKLTNAKSKFEFETPTATASIRGTRVGFEVSGQQTDVRVYEGKVFVVPKGSKSGAEVGANQMTAVKAGQKTVKIVKLEEPEPAESVGQVDSAAADTTRSDSTTAEDSITAEGAEEDTAAAVKDSAMIEDTSEAEDDAVDQSDTATVEDKDTTARIDLRLNLITPKEGAVFRPNSQIAVAGKISSPKAKVVVEGKPATVTPGGDFRLTLNSPAEAGDYDITVEASLEGESKSAMVRYRVELLTKELQLVINSPTDRQEFSKPVITIHGLSTPGAEITCSGMKFQVGSNGAFSGQVPIPDEEGELELEFDAMMGGESKTVTRSIVYKRDVMALNLNVSSPYGGQKVSEVQLQASGQVTPFDAEVYAAGRKMSVGAKGSFTGLVMIPKEPGEHEIEFEASTDDKTVTVARRVEYVPPPDRDRPQIQGQLPAMSQERMLPFAVIDRTPDDEIIFYKEIDGSRDSENGEPGGRFYLELEEGVHDYAVWAEDKAKNSSARLAGNVAYMGNLITIKMIDPMGNKFFRLPPGAPGSDFDPEYTVRFRLENLPDEDPETLSRLIKEIRVTNLTSGRTETMNNPTDTDIEIDIELRRNAVNNIEVKVVDIKDRVFTRTATIHVQ